MLCAITRRYDKLSVVKIVTHVTGTKIRKVRESFQDAIRTNIDTSITFLFLHITKHAGPPFATCS